jgi:hypothetical protein
VILGVSKPPIAIATVTTHVDALSVAKATQNAASALHSPNTLVSQPTSAAAKPTPGGGANTRRPTLD